MRVTSLRLKEKGGAPKMGKAIAQWLGDIYVLFWLSIVFLSNRHFKPPKFYKGGSLYLQMIYPLPPQRDYPISRVSASAMW